MSESRWLTAKASPDSDRFMMDAIGFAASNDFYLTAKGLRKLNIALKHSGIAPIKLASERIKKPMVSQLAFSGG